MSRGHAVDAVKEKMDDPRPPCLIPGTKKQNPEYSKWYVRNNREKVKKKNAECYQKRRLNPEAMAKERASKQKYREKNRSEIRRSGRDYYSRTKISKLAKEKKRRQLPKVKAHHRKYMRERKRKESETNSRLYQKARIVRQKRLRQSRADKPGFVYFFKCITPGYYKAGCTVNWENRRRNYSGPARVEKMYFLRPVRDRFYAETFLKIFLENAGYKPCGKSGRKRVCDWFTL